MDCSICHKDLREHSPTRQKRRIAYIRLPGRGFVRIGTYYPRCPAVLLDRDPYRN